MRRGGGCGDDRRLRGDQWRVVPTPGASNATERVSYLAGDGDLLPLAQWTVGSRALHQIDEQVTRRSVARELERLLPLRRAVHLRVRDSRAQAAAGRPIDRIPHAGRTAIEERVIGVVAVLGKHRELQLTS